MLISRFCFVLLGFCLLCSACAKVTETNQIQTSEIAIVTEQPISTAIQSPTLSDEDAGELLLSLFENNGGCTYPCYWGITPGQSSWNEVRSFIETFGSVRLDRTNPSLFWAHFAPSNLNGGEYNFGLYVDEDQILMIKANNPLTFSEIFQSFGYPDDLKITSEITPEGIAFELLMFYGNTGILFDHKFSYMYINPEVVVQGEHIYLNICTHDLTSFSPSYQTGFSYVLLWDPGLQYSYDDVYNLDLQNSPRYGYNFSDFSSVSGIPPSSFYTMLTGEIDACFLLECRGCSDNLH